MAATSSKRIGLGAWLPAGATVAAALVGVAGCGGTLPASRELVAARAALVDAKRNAGAGLATAELAQAQTALDEAEHARERSDEGEARHLAYLALRQAEHARIAGLYHADLAALEEARRRLDRLQQNIRRRSPDPDASF